MKHLLINTVLFLLTFLLPVALFAGHTNDRPDSVYLFSYSSPQNNYHTGLQFAWSTDRLHWYTIGNNYGFLRSDYGRWGSEKKMISPFLLWDNKGNWHCIWSVNDRTNQFAHAASADLVDWKRQSYPYLTTGQNCQDPVVKPDAKGNYIITYRSKGDQYYSITTKDFTTYGPVMQAMAVQYSSGYETVTLPSGTATGQVHKVPHAVVDKLIKTWELQQYRDAKNNESTAADEQRFATLKPVTAKLTIQPAATKPISDMLLGIFFEDISYAADGGLYGELIQNRDFEYALSDKEGRDTSWNSRHSWLLQGEGASFTIDSINPIHANNLHYATLNTTQPGARLINSGYDGILLKAGAQYNLSFFARNIGHNNTLWVKLVGKNNTVIAATKQTITSNKWQTYQAVLTATTDADSAWLELQPLSPGTVSLDMVSLFPQQTFHNRPNGLRNDLAQTIADIHPKFVRFPGGCVSHGDGLGNIYRWKNTIGPLEARKPQRNLWGYHQSAGLGFFEYFQFCEDIGAAPVPVIAAGVPCQNSATGGGGQQGGIPMPEMDAYIQDILDLVEYANGDVNTHWGKLRAAAGHPQPFNLKYIGIGNEDLITDVFEERFTMIYNALKHKHPEITVIGTVGPNAEGTDYEEGWGIASKLQVPMVDEHYYQPAGWFINHQDFYDTYDRSKPKVYLGEYAAFLPRKPNNIETALAEALYLTSLERNGDVVHMASYAPLLAKDGHTQWHPDMIYFNNKSIRTTTDYYVQQLYGMNAGDQYISHQVTLSNDQEAVQKRIGISIVRDSKTNDLIIKMVNLLPVTVNMALELPGIPAGATAISTILQGKPTDANARPVMTTIAAADISNTALPAYSFTVLRVHGL